MSNSSSPYPDLRKLSPLLTTGNDNLTTPSQSKSPRSRHTSQEFPAVNVASLSPNSQALPSPHKNDANHLRRKPVTPGHSPQASIGGDSKTSPYNSPYLHPVDHRSLTPLDVPPLPNPSALDSTVPLSTTTDGSGMRSREGSRSRPNTPGGADSLSGTESMPSSPKLRKAAKRRSWFPKSGGSNGNDGSQQMPAAWIAGHFDNVAYNLVPLTHGEKVFELWKDDGDTLVYLFPRASGKAASFKINSSCFADSQELTRLTTVVGPSYQTLQNQAPAHAQTWQPERNTVQHLEEEARKLSLGSSRSPFPARVGSPESDASSSASLRLMRDFGSLDDTLSQAVQKELYIPLPFEGDVTSVKSYTVEDVDLLVSYRNFFAFLCGERLVATRRQKSPFRIFWSLCKILHRFAFSNLDGSTLGEVPTERIADYVTQLRLNDVRNEPEKMIEALILGEQLKHRPLYNTAFAHAVANVEAINKLKSPRYNLISQSTRHDLERGSLDLAKRVQSATVRLQDLEIHVLWTGLAKSTTTIEYKNIDFKTWRTAFAAFRSHVISYYSARFKSWPPKGGFNRLNLREVYHDFAALYDLLVDRNSQTPRSTERGDIRDENEDSNLALRALRQILADYDASVAPLQPPMPFDVPLLPQVEHRSQAHKKRLTSNEISNSLVTTSYNKDGLAAVASNAFVESFLHFERKTEGHIDNLLSARMGHWLLLYAVLQALPILAVDAPGAEPTNGVSYFVSVPPLTGSGPSSVATLAASKSGLEAIFYRSHAWQRAREWGAVTAFDLSPPILAPPPQIFTQVDAASGSPGGSPSGSPVHAYGPGGGFNGGAAPVPVAAGGGLAIPRTGVRRVDRPLSTHSFNDILKDMQGREKVVK